MYYSLDERLIKKLISGIKTSFNPEYSVHLDRDRINVFLDKTIMDPDRDVLLSFFFDIFLYMKMRNACSMKRKGFQLGF